MGGKPSVLNTKSTFLLHSNNEIQYSTGLLLFVFYQRRAFNRPKALGSDRGYAGSDSGGYLDDQCQSSYTNSHLDIPKVCFSYWHIAVV